MTLLDSCMNHSFITPEGIFTQEQLLVAKILNEFDDQIHLVRVENPDIAAGEKECAVLILPHSGQQPYALFYLNRADIGWSTIARVYDSKMTGRSLADALQVNEMAKEILQAAQREEEAAERKELARAILKSKLHTYKHNGKVYR